MPQKPGRFDFFAMPPPIAPVPLDPTPLAQTNPNMAAVMDFLGGLSGLKDALVPTSSGATVAGAGLGALLPFAAMGGLRKVAAPIKAYHGSPHDFEKFSLSKIGTGEGAQAYGHGLYFAENPAVANQYKNDLGLKVPAFDQRPVKTSAEASAHELLKNHGTKDAALRELDRYQRAGVFSGKNEAQKVADIRAAIEANAGKSLDPVVQGKTYEVGIHASPDEFLDWDKPLSQQSEKIQQSVKGLIGDVRPAKTSDGWYSVTRVTPDGSGRLMSSDIKESTAEAAMQAYDRWATENSGSNLYRMIGDDSRGAGQASGPIVATDKLKSAGIKGIRYKDQGSRGTEGGTSNFVVFDDAIIDIMKKYGVGITTAAGILKTQQAQKPQER